MAGATQAIAVADRPELAEQISSVLDARWPRFLLQGHPGHQADLTDLALNWAPQHQVMLCDAADEVLGVGLSLPLQWDGTGSLPQGWDGAIDKAAALRDSGGSPTAVCALSITMTAAGGGRGFSGLLVKALQDAAAAAGASFLVAPVRPTLKSRYPLIPMESYAAWRTSAGDVFDPWTRLHLRLGGVAAGIAWPSMTITGSTAEWEAWTELALPGSGEYVIPGGLVPLRLDRDADLGIYEEPNLWIVHSTDTGRTQGMERRAKVPVQGAGPQVSEAPNSAV